MIQDKIFFDEKDPTGVSYNTPFTVYGSYEGRLWSKTPTGSIKFYTQNSDLSVYATTGSNQFSGSQTVTGSLTVTGGITGSVTTASYVEYTGVANKPTLVSSSSQVTYSGLTGVPSGIVSGSSQVTYSGISSIPAGIVSSSAQVGGYGIFATTGSNQFNGSQAITGSLTVTGQVVAQTLNVQQVTSSIVFSSGSNIFGNSLDNTQQFTGSVSVTGSLTVNEVMSLNNDGTYGSTYKTLGLTGNTNGSHRIFAGTADNIYIAAATGRGIYLCTNGTVTPQLTIASTGAATFASSIAASGQISTGNGADADILINFSAAGAATKFASIQSSVSARNLVLNPTNGGNVGIGTASPNGKLDIVGNIYARYGAGDKMVFWYSDDYYFGITNPSTDVRALKITAQAVDGTSTIQFYTGNNAERMRITSGGNVGIGTTDPQSSLHIYTTNATAIIQNSSTSAVENISRLFYRALLASGNTAFIGFIDGVLDSTTQNTGYLKFHTYNNGNADERMRITSGGNVGIGTNSPNAKLESQVGLPTLTAGLFYNYVGDQTATTLILRSARPDVMYQMQIFNNTSTECFRIEANGNVKNTNSSYGSLSDIKIKENISDATPKLDDLLKVRIRNYNIIGQEVKQIGVIAQELEEIFPSMVDENQDRDNDGNLLETTTKGVKYSVFVPILIKSIQEQQTQIESLKSENDTLKSILQRNNIS